jgi:hypothetical protein
MNPNVGISWTFTAFPMVMFVLAVLQFWRSGLSRNEPLDLLGVVSVMLAFLGVCAANIFYQGVFPVKIWPLSQVKDQIIVTSSGDIFVSLSDPVAGFAERIQRYSCDGKFIAAYQPDNAGGIFKFLVKPDQRLEIYNVRTGSIDVFKFDGGYVEQRSMDRSNVPFEFLKPGPSITNVNSCEFIRHSASGRSAIKNQWGIREFEKGDWILEYILNRTNIAFTLIFGGIMFVVAYIKNKQRQFRI